MCVCVCVCVYIRAASRTALREQRPGREPVCVGISSESQVYIVWVLDVLAGAEYYKRAGALLLNSF